MAQRTANTGRFLALDRARIEETVKDMEPAERSAAYVVVNGRRYTARKVLSAATGRSLKQVSAATALESLGRLGFVTGERRTGKTTLAFRVAIAARAQQADSDLDQQLREHVGEWVAVRDGELLVAAPEAKTVIAWLKEHGDSAEAMYKVPRDLAEISGTAA